MPEEVTAAEPKKPALFSIHSQRLRVCILMMLSGAIAQCMRLNLSMGLPCMINATLSHELYNTTLKEENTGTLDWSPQQKSAILSASSWGSLVATLLAGYVSDKFKPKIVITLGVLGMAIMTALGPLFANISYYLFFASRTIQGISGGFIFPAGSAMASRWYPTTERSTLASIYSVGSTLGSSVTPLIVALLCTSFLGWSSLFYVFAIAGLVFVIFWVYVVSNHPSSNRLISDEEREYLEREISFSGRHGKGHEKGADNFPWTKLLFSPPLLANYTCQFSYQFAQTAMQQFLPLFLNDHLGFSITKNGLYTTLPFTLNVFFGLFWGRVADLLKEKKLMTPTMAAKVFQAIDCFGSAFAIALIAIIPTVENPNSALIFLLIFGVTFPAGVSGYFTSLISICPQYSGTVMSISRGWGLVSHMGTPWMMTLFNYWGLKQKWIILYGLAAVFQLISGVLFTIYGDCEVQSWARKVEPRKEDPENVPEETKID